MKEYKLTDAVPLPHTEKLLNEIVPERFPDWEVLTVFTFPHVAPNKGLALSLPGVKAGGLMVQMVAAILVREKKEN